MRDEALIPYDFWESGGILIGGYVGRGRSDLNHPNYNFNIKIRLGEK